MFRRAPPAARQLLVHARMRTIATVLAAVTLFGCSMSPADAGDPEAIPQQEFNATVQQETLESYSDDTRDDLLGKLGYNAQA